MEHTEIFSGQTSPILFDKDSRFTAVLQIFKEVAYQPEGAQSPKSFLMSQIPENVTYQIKFDSSGNRSNEHHTTEVLGLPRSTTNHPSIQHRPKRGVDSSRRPVVGPVHFPNPYHLDEVYHHPQRRQSFAPVRTHTWTDMMSQTALQQDFQHQHNLGRDFESAVEWDSTGSAYGDPSRFQRMRLEAFAPPSCHHDLQGDEDELPEGLETDPAGPTYLEHPHYVTVSKRHELSYNIGHTASGRKPRSHIWPALSDVPPRIPLPRFFESKTILKGGRNSGRNLLANFLGSDGTPRTRYNLRILSGRGTSYLPHVHRYPACDTQIPACLTLEEICEQFPRHVWGTGLRMFIAEGWTGEKIYNALPEDFRDSKAVQRPWNYIQQGFTREVGRMNEEDGLSSKVVKKRKREDSADVDDDLYDAFQQQPRKYKVCERVQPAQSWNMYPENGRHTVLSSPCPRQDSPTPSLHPDNMEISAPTDEDLAVELLKHEILLLAILKVCRPDLCSESLDSQMGRIHFAQATLFVLCGIESEDMNLEELISFGERLEEVVDNLQSTAIPAS